jgi:phage tail-like protein
MVQASATGRPRDPVMTHNFGVRVAGATNYVAFVSSVKGLNRTTKPVEHPYGGDNGFTLKVPGRTTYDAITLERAVTTDLFFEQWANRVWSYANAGGGLQTSLQDFRQDLVIDAFNGAGQKVLSYQVFNAWVSEYKPAADFDASASAISVQHIKLENEGWVRDVSVVPPAEPSFSDPAG